MDWPVAIVSLGGVIATAICIGCYIEYRGKNPKQFKDAEIFRLQAKVEALQKEISVMEDRGDHHSSSRDAAEKRLERMHDIFADIIKRTGEADNLRALLEKALDKKKV